GYKDFQSMDTLRDRDFTYPVANPEHEMKNSGNGKLFLSFIQEELMRDIDKKYAVDTTRRVLAGHSLGGFFALYALRQNLMNHNKIFCGYIAASPATNYNHNYILTELEKLQSGDSRIKTFVTFGSLEYEEEEDSTM